MFVFRKWLETALMPLPFALLVAVVGLVLLWRGRRQRAGRGLVAAGLLLILAFSCKPLPRALVRSLEGQYPPYVPAAHAGFAPAWIVVLAGGSSDGMRLPATGRLSRSSLARLVEGIRLLRHYPGSRLLVSGGAVFISETEASALRQAAVQLGVPPERITMDDVARSTEEQAVTVPRMVRGDPFVLVTSAYHMPRAMALFRKRGLSPMPAPTDYLFKGGRETHPQFIYPSADNLCASTIAIHEYLGLAWARLRGTI